MGVTFKRREGAQDALQFLDRMKMRAASYQIPEEELHLVFLNERDDAEELIPIEPSLLLFLLAWEEMSDKVRSDSQENGLPIKGFPFEIEG